MSPRNEKVSKINEVTVCLPLSFKPIVPSSLPSKCTAETNEKVEELRNLAVFPPPFSHQCLMEML